MDAIEQLKQDVRDGRIDLDRLIDVIVTQQRQLAAAKQHIEELEKKWGKPSPTAKVDESFSMRAEEKRQQARQPKNNTMPPSHWRPAATRSATPPRLGLSSRSV